MYYSTSQFRSTVTEDFERRRAGLDVRLSKSLAESKALGHPRFETLQVGQKASAPIAAVFLDLTQFTRRTFWDDPAEVADLAHAIMTGFIEAVSAFGGFPLGLRGDGLFAGFGPGASEVDVAYALAACAFCLNGVASEINPWLTARSIHPVQARAGIDHGDLTFVRSGSRENSEVNVIGFAANFAAKCEKTANSWEVVAGQGAVSAIGGNSLCVPHEDSPKVYSRGADRRRYHFYDYRWRQLLPVLPSALRELNGNSTTTIQAW